MPFYGVVVKCGLSYCGETEGVGQGALSGTLGCKGKEVTGGAENRIMRVCVICTLQHVL